MPVLIIIGITLNTSEYINDARDQTTGTVFQFTKRVKKN